MASTRLCKTLNSVHTLQVLRSEAIPVVEVIRDIAGVAVQRLAGRVSEGVPDAGSSPAFPRPALHLRTQHANYRKAEVKLRGFRFDTRDL